MFFFCLFFLNDTPVVVFNIIILPSAPNICSYVDKNKILLTKLELQGINYYKGLYDTFVSGLYTSIKSTKI